MLLKDYLLLNLGRVTLEEARRWQAEMRARRQVDATRDLLAFWRPQKEDGPARVGQLAGLAIFHPYRFGGDLELPEFRTGLTDAVRQALAGLGLEAGIDGGEVVAGEKPVARVESRLEADVLVGEVYIEMGLVGELLLREIPAAQLANAVAYHVEQRFGYAQAAIHPVAYEEQMRPRTNI